jgi:hypothetical protein
MSFITIINSYLSLIVDSSIPLLILLYDVLHIYGLSLSSPSVCFLYFLHSFQIYFIQLCLPYFSVLW